MAKRDVAIAKRIMVTGGAGFIGSAVCRHLVKDLGREVVVVDKLTYAANLASLSPVSSSPLYHFEKVDICDAAGMARLFELHRPGGVLHLAAESHVDRSISGSRVFLDTNVVGTFTLLESVRAYLAGMGSEAADQFRLVHVSTDEVFGSLSDVGLFNETSPYDPSSPYSATKAASDHLAKAWGRTYGLPVIISNCSNNYGPYHFPEKLIPLTILAALQGKPLPVYGDGANVRDWLYVDDHARALVMILDGGRPGETYNIGGRNEQRNIDVVRRICDVLDVRRPNNSPHGRLITHVPDRPGHDRRYAIDASKLENELGWRAQETFATGLEKTVDWYLNRRDWWGGMMDRAYDGRWLDLIQS